jgi:hypothetical protein
MTARFDQIHGMTPGATLVSQNIHFLLIHIYSSSYDFEDLYHINHLTLLSPAWLNQAQKVFVCMVDDKYLE